MFYYREKDGGLQREYEISEILESRQTEKSLLEVFKTTEFGTAFFLDGELQMTEKDEYIYHEMLVHPAMSCYESPVNICIVGGGDGCAARELLKWPNVQTVDIYDWDKDVVKLFQHKYSFWNHQSLSDSKVITYAENALTISPENYDLLFVDLVDPDLKDPDSKKFWSEFLPKLAKISETSTVVLNVGGMYPWDDKNTSWILMMLASIFQKNETHTLETYKTFVPSFGYEWCFFMIKPIGFHVNTQIFETMRRIRYFDKNAWLLATTWTKDSTPMLPKTPVKLKNYLPPL
jgi:predicted membrane-bound spermidine synthase